MKKLSNNHEKTNKDRSAQKETAKSMRPKSILEAFESIVELAEDSDLSDEFLTNASVCIRYATRKLRLTPIQTVLLSIFIDRSEDNSIQLSEIAGFVGCRTIRMLRLSKEIDILEQKRYVIASRGSRSLTYRVNPDAIKALKDDKPYEHVATPINSVQDFFDYFSELMQQKENNELSHDLLAAAATKALAEIRDTHFGSTLKRFSLGYENNILFVFMAHLFIENNDDNIRFHDIDNLYDNDKTPNWIRCELRGHDSSLFSMNLIENVNEDGMARSDAFKLTDFAKQDLLSELNLETNSKSRKGLEKYDSLVEKQLIYNDKEAEQISQLSYLLGKDRFADVQSRLRDAGMRPGFCCLFYGAPGTGKTETVYQLARMTGRDIMRVDVDKIKSCWVGESEKNIKALFTRYRNICRDSIQAPILLFNEADAVLGVRMEGANRAVDKMENSIQNIILQEMETIDGIMIATTNLTSNLDKAFERRFLYKIRFDKPTTEARAAIWRVMMPGLSTADARVLASEFELSGGEIENIVRKQSVNAILSASEIVNLDEIRKLCKNERISKTGASGIGFVK